MSPFANSKATLTYTCLLLLHVSHMFNIPLILLLVSTITSFYIPQWSSACMFLFHSRNTKGPLNHPSCGFDQTVHSMGKWCSWEHASWIFQPSGPHEVNGRSEILFMKQMPAPCKLAVTMPRWRQIECSMFGSVHPFSWICIQYCGAHLIKQAAEVQNFGLLSRATNCYLLMLGQDSTCYVSARPFFKVMPAIDRWQQVHSFHSFLVLQQKVVQGPFKQTPVNSNEACFITVV